MNETISAIFQAGKNANELYDAALRCRDIAVAISKTDYGFQDSQVQQLINAANAKSEWAGTAVGHAMSSSHLSEKKAFFNAGQASLKIMRENVQKILRPMNPVRAILGGASGIAAAWSAIQTFWGLELGVIAFSGAEAIAVAAVHVCAAGAAGYGVGWVDAKARHFVISNVAEKLLDRRDIGCEYDLAYVAFGSAYNYAAEAVGSDSRIETR